MKRLLEAQLEAQEDEAGVGDLRSPVGQSRLRGHLYFLPPIPVAAEKEPCTPLHELRTALRDFDPVCFEMGRRIVEQAMGVAARIRKEE